MVAITKNVFVPITAFLFLGIAVLACLYSGIIEYSVLKQLIAVPVNTGSFIKPETWALILVFVLEGSKFTLHFYSSALKRKQVKAEIGTELNAKKFYRVVVGVKNSLIAVSFICSIIFVTNIFFHGNDDAKLQAIEDSNESCDAKLDIGKAKLDDEYTTYIEEHLAIYSSELDSISSLEAKLSEREEQITNTDAIIKRGDLQEEAEAIRTQINAVKDNYADIKKTITAEALSIKNEGLARLEKRYGDNGTERIVDINDIKVASTGDNIYLSTFLGAFSQTFFSQTYGRTAYFAFAISIAIIIAAVLEACIYISQTLLTISENTFFTIMGESTVTDNEKRIVKIFSWLIFSIACLLAFYILSGLLLTVNLTRRNIIMAIATYSITMVLMNLVWSHRNTNVTARLLTSESEPLWKKMLFTIREAAIPAILAFVGYVMIGFIFNGDFIYGDLNALAIALGGTLAQCFQKKNYCY